MISPHRPFFIKEIEFGLLADQIHIGLIIRVSGPDIPPVFRLVMLIHKIVDIKLVFVPEHLRDHVLAEIVLGGGRLGIHFQLPNQGLAGE